MERYWQRRADWDPGIGQSALPCRKDLFFNENKNLQKKEKTVTKVAVSFTVSLGDTCAWGIHVLAFSLRGSAGGRGHGLNNIMVHVWRLHRLTDCGVV